MPRYLLPGILVLASCAATTPSAPEAPGAPETPVAEDPPSSADPAPVVASTSEAPAAGPPYEYPAEVSDAFMTACVAEGGEDVRPVCTCVLGKLSWRHTPEDFANDAIDQVALESMVHECLEGR
jgi:hypothetical protein